MNNNSEIKSLLSIREKELKNKIMQLNQSLMDSPSGHLKISKRKNRTNYYHVDSSISLKPIYISQSNLSLAKSLAQKSYDEKVIKILKKEYENITSLLQLYENQSPDDIYYSLQHIRQSLINPISLSDDDYARKWEAIPYGKKSFSAEDTSTYYTNRNERVRSKSEIIIANMLLANKIPYKYECPLKLDNCSWGDYIYPDFTVLNKRTKKIYYLEHFGAMDNFEYFQRSVIERINLYEKNGYLIGDQVLFTHETSNNPLNTRLVSSMIEKFFI